MKKIVAATVALVAIALCTSCAVRVSEIDKNSSYYSTIIRGSETHNFVVLANQNEQIIELQKKILETQEKSIEVQEKIIENQEKILELLQR